MYNHKSVYYQSIQPINKSVSHLIMLQSQWTLYTNKITQFFRQRLDQEPSQDICLCLC